MGLAADFAAFVSVAFAFATDFMVSFLGDTDAFFATALGLEVVTGCLVVTGLVAALTAD